MPAASLLLPLLGRLLHLIPSVLRLLPALLRPPPLTPHYSPLTPSTRPPFAVGRSPFVVSPSASSGQALSNHERPLHRPAYPNLLALPPSYRRPPLFRLWTPTRPNRGPADPAPRQPAPPKIRQISRPLARLPLRGSRASGREYPKNPHRHHRRLPPGMAGGNPHPVLPRPAPSRRKKTTRCAPRVNPASAESLP